MREGFSEFGPVGAKEVDVAVEAMERRGCRGAGGNDEGVILDSFGISTREIDGYCTTVVVELRCSAVDETEGTFGVLFKGFGDADE